MKWNNYYNQFKNNNVPLSDANNMIIWKVLKRKLRQFLSKLYSQVLVPKLHEYRDKSPLH